MDNCLDRGKERIEGVLSENNRDNKTPSNKHKLINYNREGNWRLLFYKHLSFEMADDAFLEARKKKVQSTPKREGKVKEKTSGESTGRRKRTSAAKERT